jgi:DNA polymerase kappa
MSVYEKERELSRTWVHIDMDMFYAACEIRDRPDLEYKPVAVGDYSMIQTTNYVARKFGVRSAMPGFLGKRMCPELVFIKSNKDKYQQISDTEFLTTLREYDPQLESCGMDEANLDITDYLQEHGMDSDEGRVFMGEKLRSEIKDKMRMTCSAGIACNKMLAKIASELDKPDGLTTLTFSQERILQFMSERKVRDIPGVGGV